MWVGTLSGWMTAKTWELTGLIRVKTENGSMHAQRVLLRTLEFKRNCEGAARRREQCHDNQGEGDQAGLFTVQTLQRGKGK